MTLIDPDPVELSNLARQVIYRIDDIGLPKVDAAARRLAARFPGTEIESHIAAFDASNCAILTKSHDFIIDATDNPTAKFLLNDACVAAGRPFVYGGVLAMSGQAMTVIPGASACIRCLFESPPDDADAQSCREAGIVGPIAGAIGVAQAEEAIRVIRGDMPALAGRMLAYDGSGSARVRITPIAARPGCRCGAAQRERNAASPA